MRGVLNFGRRGSVWTGALACFIGINAALDAPADSSADASHRVESIREDEGNDSWQFGNVHADNNQGHQDVAERHERHNDLGEMRDALYATKDNDAEKCDGNHCRGKLRKTDIAKPGLQHATAAKSEFSGRTDAV